MELFSITCTTCKTRLKVRDASAIGQIMACPRCGGMVMVKKPDPKAEAAEQSGIAAQQHAAPLVGDTIGDSAFEGIDDLLEGREPRETPAPRTAQPAARKPAPPVAPPPVGSVPAAPPQPVKPVAAKLAPPKPAETKPSEVTATQAKPAAAKANEAGPVVDRAAAETTPADPAIAPKKVAERPSAENHAAKPAAGLPQHMATAADPRSPESVIHSPQSLPGPPGSVADQQPDALPQGDWNDKRPWRFGIVVGGAIAIGVLLAVGVVLVSLKILRGNGEVETIASSIDSTGNGAANVPAVPTTDPAAPAAGVAEQGVTDPAEPEVPSTEPPVTTDVPAEVPTEPAVAEVPPATDPPAEADPSEPLINPLPADSPEMAANPGDQPGANPALSPDVPPAVNPGANPLGQFGALIDGAAANPLPDVEAPIVAGDLPIDEMPAAGDSLPRPAPRTIEVAKRLADPLPAIDISGVPLVDVLDVFSSLSTIPITLRIDALPMVKATARSPVTYRATSTTVGTALRDALAPLGLAYVVVDDQLVVGLRETPELAVIRYPVKDLTQDDPEQVAELEHWIRSCVTPGLWTGEEKSPKITPEPGVLAIAHTRDAHWQIVLLTEKLRQARRLPPLSRFDRKLFETVTRSELASSKLSQPVMLNFTQPTNFQSIVKRLAGATGTTLVINWQSLATAGWNPDGEATLLAEKIPLEEALAKLLGPMDLGVRAVDANTLEIAATSTINSASELEFYRVDPLLSADTSGQSLVEQLAAVLPPGTIGNANDPGDESAEGVGGQLFVDSASKCLIASLPQPMQRQLAAEISRLLAASSSTPAAAAIKPTVPAGNAAATIPAAR